MINLIPQFAKKSVTTEYWIRVVTVWFILWGCGLLIAGTLLFPSYILSDIQIKSYSESAAVAEDSVQNYETVSKQLSSATMQARKTIDSGSQVHMSRYLELFESLTGEDISISSIELARSEDGLSPVMVIGYSATRESLASYRDRLLEQSVVEQVDLPISNLAKDRDILFSLTVTINNETTL